MVGAGVIAAVSNALHRRSFPFVFGGDGASFAVSPADTAPAVSGSACRPLPAFRARGIPIRISGVATISVRDIRATWRDVRVARYGATPYCVYAMFMGGGLAWFEDEVKRGRHLLPAAPAGARPDLSGSPADGASPRAQKMASSCRLSSRRAGTTCAF